MVFLKLVHTEYQVNYKTQPFLVKVVYLVSNVQNPAGHAVIALSELFFNCSDHRTEILFSFVFDSAKILLTIFMNSSKESNPGTPGYSANIGLISETSFWGFNFVQSIFWVPLFPLPHLKIEKIIIIGVSC